MSWLSDETLNHLRQVAGEPDLSHTKYRILRKLDEGGMATIYLAYDNELDREVALKVVELADANGELKKRMLREAKIVARLEHPGIVPIHDVGILPDDRVFYTMKYVKGERLDRFSSNRNLSERLRVFEKICEAVAFAHAQGVIHRDLKPENIMVGAFGEVLVMDWGLAKILHQAKDAPVVLPQSRSNEEKTSSRTDHGTVMGTPAYMSPEQASGETDKVNERTDVYALGSILYFLLTGSAPFDKQENRQNVFVTPRHRNSQIARPIEAVCLKAMAQLQANRYADALELAGDVARYLNGLPVHAYRESIFEILQRWLSRNYFVVLLVLAYLIMRVLLFIFLGR